MVTLRVSRLFRALYVDEKLRTKDLGWCKGLFRHGPDFDTSVVPFFFSVYTSSQEHDITIVCDTYALDPETVDTILSTLGLRVFVTNIIEGISAMPDRTGSYDYVDLLGGTGHVNVRQNSFQPVGTPATLVSYQSDPFVDGQYTLSIPTGLYPNTSQSLCIMVREQAASKPGIGDRSTYLLDTFTSIIMCRRYFSPGPIVVVFFHDGTKDTHPFLVTPETSLVDVWTFVRKGLCTKHHNPNNNTSGDKWLHLLERLSSRLPISHVLVLYHRMGTSRRFDPVLQRGASPPSSTRTIWSVNCYTGATTKVDRWTSQTKSAESISLGSYNRRYVSMGRILESMVRTDDMHPGMFHLTPVDAAILNVDPGDYPYRPTSDGMLIIQLLAPIRATSFSIRINGSYAHCVIDDKRKQSNRPGDHFFHRLLVDRVPTSVGRLRSRSQAFGFQQKRDHLIYPVPPGLNGHDPFPSRTGKTGVQLRAWLAGACAAPATAADHYAVVIQTMLVDLHFIGAYNPDIPYYTIPELIERIETRKHRSAEVEKYKELLQWQNGDVPFRSKHGPYDPIDLVRLLTESE